MTDRLDVGGTSVARGGTGTVQVGPWGVLMLQKTGVSGRVWSGSSISISDLAELQLSGSLEVEGTLSVVNATVSGGTVTLLPGGVLSGEGDVASAITTGTDTTTRIVASGELSLASGSGASLTNRGLLEVGPHLVTLAGNGHHLVGNATLADGKLRLLYPGTLEAGKRITGSGSIEGRLTCLGDVVASGPAGLSVAGVLAGTGTGIGGTLLHFTSSGVFTGGGHMNLPILADAGSEFLLGSDLVMGQAGVANALTLAGEISVGTHVLELRSGSEVVLSGATTINTGTLRLSGGGPRVRVAPGVPLTVNGTLNTALAVDGQLTLTSSFAPTTVAGAFTCSPTCSTTFEFRNGESGDYGRIAATGALDLAGAIDVRFPGDWRPVPGQRLEVLGGVSRTDNFTTLLFEGAPVGGQYSLDYTPNGVWVVFSELLDVPASPGASLPTALAFAAVGSPGPGVTLELALPAAADVSLDVFDVRGRRAAKLHEGTLGAGRHRFDPGGARLAPGVYYARVQLSSHEGTESRIARFVTVR